MKLLDAMVENSFKKTDDGKELFYPSGAMGKGVIIPNEAEKCKISRFIKGYYIFSFALIFAMVILKEYLLFFAIAIISCIVYYAVINGLVKNLEKSDTKLTVKDTMSKASKNYSKGFIIFGLVMGIIFTLLGLFSILLVSAGLNILAPICLLSVGLFLFIVYLRLLIYSGK